jgi:lantibiotic biosynthesis protein
MPDPPFRPAEFCVLRTALLPFSVLIDWTAGVTAPGHLDDETLASRVASDAALLRARLRTLVSRPEIVEALYVASPSTGAALIEWLEDPDGQDSRLEHTLVRYLQRMAGRATPFGLFAGCSIGRIDATTTFEIAGLPEYRRYSRLDNDYLFALTDALEQRDEVRRAVRYRPNSSLFRSARRWRYARATVNGSGRQYHFVTLDPDDALETVLVPAGATVDELAERLVVAHPERWPTRPEAAAYIFALADQQVLVSNLAPIITGREALDDVVEQLQSMQGLRGVMEALVDVRHRLRQIDLAPLGIQTDGGRRVQCALDQLDVAPAPAHLVQVEMIKPAPNAACGTAVLGELARAALLLHQITPAAKDALEAFRAAFTARYQAREVPLLEVLDDETDIPFDRESARLQEHDPPLDGLPFPMPPETSRDSLTGRDAFLLSKVEALRSEGRENWDLTDADIARLTQRARAPLPDAFSVMAVLSAAGTCVGDEFALFVRSVYGPSGATVFGRFCHAEPRLREHVARYLADEEALRPDAIFAEVVHLPDGHFGNVVARPVLRGFEIPYLGGSGVAEAHQIPASDLLVSVQGSRVVLRSSRIGREVIPRMTHAHNGTRGPAVYRFLSLLQHQGVASWLAWQWGALDYADFLPRVTHGRLVLARARWRLDRRALACMQGEPHEQFAALQKWRLARRMPRFAAVVEGDNELPLDFENVFSVDTFLRLARTRDSAILVEMFPAPDRLAAFGPEGRFVHEAVVPFVTRQPVATPAAAETRPSQTADIRRTFVPGSEWLYLKWYAGPASVDALLGAIVPALVRGGTRRGRIGRWFFSRHADPRWHLRVLVQGDAAELRTIMAEASDALEPALRDGGVWKVQVDTYEREIERYGGDSGMMLAEELFWRDSEAVLDVLQTVAGETGMALRWQLCVRGWDLLLTDFGLTLESRRALTQETCARHARQLGAQKTLARALDDRFRRVRASIERVFDEDHDPDHPLTAPLRHLRTRSAALAPVIHALHDADRTGRLAVPLATLVRGFLREHANRMLRAAHARQELVLYELLDRWYESRIARQRGRGQRSAPPKKMR